MKSIKTIVLVMVMTTTPAYFHAIEHLTTVIAVGTAVTLICQTYFVGQEIYDRAYPDAEKQVNNLVLQEQREYARAKNDFQKCLSNTTLKTPRNDRNIPVPCQSLASAFIRCGGKNELIELIKNFDDAQE